MVPETGVFFRYRLATVVLEDLNDGVSARGAKGLCALIEVGSESV